MASLLSTGQYDATLGEIRFVVNREPNPAWQVNHVGGGEHYILAYADAGVARYHFDEADHVVKRGAMLFFPPGWPHQGRSHPRNPWRFYSTAFALRPEKPASEAAFLALPRLVQATNPAEVSALFNELDQCWTRREVGYLLRCRGLILRLLALLVESAAGSTYNTPHERRIRKIITLLQENYTRSYSVNELAAVADLSPSHFRMLFKRVTGLPVIKYQNMIRINKAKDLMLSGECNVTQAAYRAGFSDIYYFSRLFKRMTGVNPSAFIDG